MVINGACIRLLGGIGSIAILLEIYGIIGDKRYHGIVLLEVCGIIGDR